MKPFRSRIADCSIFLLTLMVIAGAPILVSIGVLLLF